MKKLPFFTILSVLLFLAVVAVIAFPTTTTTHIHGTAEKWSNDETYLGTCPIEIDIQEIKSLCFHYHYDVSVKIGDYLFPPFKKNKSVLYSYERKNFKHWSVVSYDPDENDIHFIELSYYSENHHGDTPEYEITLVRENGNIVYRAKNVYADGYCSVYSPD